MVPDDSQPVRPVDIAECQNANNTGMRPGPRGVNGKKPGVGHEGPLRSGPEEFLGILVGGVPLPSPDLRDSIETGSVEEISLILLHRTTSLSETISPRPRTKSSIASWTPTLTLIQLGKRKPVIVRIMTPFAMSCR